MSNYVPFIKLKQNEIMALKELEASTKEILVPFFDFPKAKEETAVRFKKTAVSRAKQIEKYLGPEFKCYLDTFDATEFLIDGIKSYAFLLNEFSGADVICVTGLSRSQEHKDSILEVADSGKINLESIAFRVGYEDIESFTAIEQEVDEALADLLELFETIDLIIDLRVCSNLPEPAIVANSIDSFVKAFIGSFSTRKVIVAGSSISSVVTDMCLPKNDKDFERAEIPIYKHLEALYSEDPKLFFGDYTVVSPNYSDLDFAPELMRKVTTSKLIYSHAHFHHIWRGESLEIAGEAQYNAHMKSLVRSSFFRGEDFSWADGQFHLKQDDNSGFGAASMIKFVVNAHIEFMVKTGI